MSAHQTAFAGDGEQGTGRIGIIARWLQIALKPDLGELLEAMIKEVPEMVGARDCSIYLLPQFVKEFDGDLLDEKLNTISHKSVNRNFVVSAHSTKSSQNRPHGKAFYSAGEGLTGWVFEQQRPLLLRNMWDKSELAQFSPQPAHSDKYGLGKDLLGKEPGESGDPDPQPFLAMPLQTEGAEPVGVLKLTGTIDSKPFPAEVKDFLEPLVRALTDLIQRTVNLERMKAMKKLMATLAAAASMREVLRTAVVETPALVDGSHCSIFLLDERTGDYVLRDTTSDLNVNVAAYAPGEGLTGWVASKKRSLRLKNLKDEAELKAIDPTLEWRDKDREFLRRPTRQFLAVPLLSTKENEPALGVIRFPDHLFNQSFTAADEALLVEFATSFVPILEAVRVREYAEMISKSKELFLASTLDRGRLLQEAVKNTNLILRGDGCSLFLRDERSGLFVLSATSAQNLQSEVGVLAYAEGEGKTGRVIKERRPLRLNPSDDPKESAKDSVEVVSGAKFLAAPVLDAESNPMGVIRLTRQRGKADFAQIDENLLSTIASMVSLSLRTLAAHETNQQIVRALLSIAETNVRLVRDQQELSADQKREHSQWLALTTVTCNDGLRFNRAALFTNTEARSVTGVCAVGPETVEAADELWNVAKDMSFDQLLRLNEREAFDGRGFHEQVKGLQLTLGDSDREEQTLPLAACRDRHAYRVQNGKVEVLMPDGFVESSVKVLDQFLQLVACNSFALIPFSGLDASPGVLYVDNRFTGRAISVDQLRPLTVFADFFGTSMSLAKAQERLLLRSARLATIGEFAASFSHQARQPLQVISGAIQLMERDPLFQDSKRLSELREGKDRMEAALRYLNAFSRRGEEMVQEPLNIEATLKRVEESVKPHLKNLGINLHIETPHDLPNILARRADVEDILVNLISNARDAMDFKGGDIMLRASSHDLGIDLEVSDTGHGIPERDRSAIFEPLFSTKEVEAGMGMGLALSRRLAEDMGGSLALKDPGASGGATFVLHIPTRGYNA